MEDNKVYSYDLYAIPPNGEAFRCTAAQEYDVVTKCKEEYDPYLRRGYEGVVYLFRLIPYVAYNECKFELRRHLDKKWAEREQARIDDGTYTCLPPEWDDLESVSNHYCHVADVPGDDLDMIAFTENANKGERDIQTRMRAGRYIKRFYPHLDNEMVRYYASAVQSMSGVQMTDDPDLAATIYANGPDSCMAYGPSNWGFYDKKGIDEMPLHPSAAYFDGDLKLAWIGSPDEADARTIVWPEKKLYGRLYGATDRLETALVREGYKSCYDYNCNAFEGARFKTIRYNQDKIVMPYLDGIQYLEYLYETGQVYFGRMHTNMGKKTKVFCREGTESGLAYFRDPSVIYCCISGKRVEKDSVTVRIDTMGSGHVALLSEATRDGYKLTEEGTYSNNPRTAEIEGVSTLHDSTWRPDRSLVVTTDGIYRPRSSCVSVNFGTQWVRRGAISSLIKWKGNYYTSVDQMGIALPNYTHGGECFNPDEIKEMHRLISSYERTYSAKVYDTMHELHVHDPARFVALINHFDRRARHGVRNRERARHVA